MKNNQSYIDQGGITVITKIKPSADITELYQLLGKVKEKMNAPDAPVKFHKVSTLHYLRWVIIDNAFDTNGDKIQDTLLFTSNFDGPVHEHYEELIEAGGDTLNEIYSFCEGYPSGENPSFEEIISYFNEHTEKNPLFWPAFRGGTVEQIKGEFELVNSIQEYIDQEQENQSFQGLTAEEIQKKIKSFVASRDDLSWALQERARPSFGWHLSYYGRLVSRILLFVLLLPLILLFILPVWWLIISRIFEKKDDKRRKPIVRDDEIIKMINEEDRIFQNQLTIYGTIKNPSWYRLTTLKMGLWLFSTNGVYRSNEGKLSGIQTIHFARWTLFNNNRNVLFLSNYDGPWQIYLSEFIDRSASAMNLTFGNMEGYPKVKHLLWEGAHDEQQFKTVVRNNQYPSQVWYSAYPYYSIKNILNNNKIRKGLDGSSDESATEWLKRF